MKHGNFFMLFFFFALAFAPMFGLWAQDPYVDLWGPKNLIVNDETTYSTSFYNGDGSSLPPPQGTVYWSTSEQIISSSNYDCIIKFPRAGTFLITYELSSPNYTFTDEIWVTVSNPPAPPATPPVPLTTFSVTQLCGSTTVTRNNNPPDPLLYDWYWQTTATGTSTTLGSAASIARTVSGPLYLRARYKASPNAWSTSSLSAGTIPLVTTPPAVPAAATDGHVIGDGNLATAVSVSTVAGATSYRWYNAAGTLIPGVSAASYVPVVAATTTYYVEAMIQQCPSATRKAVTANRYPAPVITKTNSGVVVNSVPVVLSVNNFSYDSYQWLNGSGADIAGATTAVYTTAVLGTYNLRVTKAGATFTTASNALVTTGLTGLNMNYVLEHVVLRPGVTTPAAAAALPFSAKEQHIRYFDELGRLIETVDTQFSPGGKDVVTPVVYDTYGRQPRIYMPFTAENCGWYKEHTAVLDGSGNYAGIAQPFYAVGSNNAIADDARPFSETVFEPSSLARPVKQYGPGNAWGPAGSNKFIETRYQLHTHGTATGQEKVIAWQVNAAGMPVRASAAGGYIESGGYFSSGQLYVQTSVDEHGHTVRTYANKKDQVVLKRVQMVTGATSYVNYSQWALTYYVYDDQGNLRYVFQPELSKKLHLGADSYVVTAADLTSLAFQYKYDAERRIAEKRVPSADWIYMVYDKRDRLVLTQDGVQRPKKQWSFTKYDELNRPIATGIKDTTAVLTQAQMQEVVTHFYHASRQQYESFVGADAYGNIHGYTNESYPFTTSSDYEADPQRYLTVIYYDNYEFRSDWPGSYTYVSDALTQAANGVTYTQPPAAFLRVTGKVTGSMAKVLDAGITGGYTWLKTVNFYDEQYRVIQSLSDNYKGGTDRMSTLYDFAGKVLQSLQTSSEYDVRWKDQVNSQVYGNVLARNAIAAGWTAGAVSEGMLAQGQDGWLEVVVGDTEANRSMVGFSDVNTNAHYNTIDYALYLNGSVLVIYEGGTPKHTSSHLLRAGDVVRVQRTGTVMRYFWNGQELPYSNTSAFTGALMADASLYINGSALVGVRTSFTGNVRKIRQRLEYDPGGRLLRTWHAVDAQPEILLSLNQYNELGQVIDRKLHSTVAAATDARQSVDTRYTIRGWLASINNSQLSSDGTSNDDTGDYFGMNLGYQADIGIGNVPQFNGNLSGLTWSSNLGLATIKEKAYSYAYDAGNRLATSDYKEKGTGWTAPANGVFAERSLAYDLNGNITSLNRNDGRATGLMDNLVYSYSTLAGNTLLRVTDNGDDGAGFADGTNTGDDYAYDANGNMTHDLNKGIGSSLSDMPGRIRYNLLNLPDSIMRGGNLVRYIYDATGRKLTQSVYFGNTLRQTDYSTGFVFENDVLQFVQHADGRVVFSGVTKVYGHDGASTTGITGAGVTLASAVLNGAQTYVKAMSTGTTVRSGVVSVGGVFEVAGGERYRIRVKGYRDKGTAASSSAAYLQFKVNGADFSWPGAALPMAAATAVAESWVEQTLQMPAAATQLEVGVVWNTVLAGEAIYLNDLEILRVETTVPEYQYHLRDHLGDVRLTFTTKADIDTGLATLEDASAATERSKFLRYDHARKVRTPLFDKTNGTATGYAQRLNGSANERYGLARSLSVMPGDKINIEVYAKYVDANSSNWTAALSTLLGQIAGGTAAAGTVVDGAGYGTSMASFPFAAQGSQNHSGDSETGPKAYLNWLVFDRNYVLIPSRSGYDRLSAAPREYGQDVAHERLFSPEIVISEPGYVYIYFSNENDTPLEVYFDDFRALHVKCPVIQSDDYYPFGMTHGSYRRENSIVNDYLYNGKEQQDELGLGWLDYGARMYQPEIARWGGIDPSSESYVNQSPYHYAGNNPVVFVDYDGNDYGVVVNRQTKTIAITAHYIANNASDLKSFNEHGRDKWNSQSRKHVFITGSVRDLKRGKADVYSIEVDISSEMVKGSRTAPNGDVITAGDDIVSNDQFGLSNSFDTMTAYPSHVNKDAEGLTGDDHITMLTRSKNSAATTHETSHSLGNEHSDKGGSLHKYGHVDGTVTGKNIAETLAGVGIGGNNVKRNQASAAGDGTLYDLREGAGLEQGMVISQRRYERIKRRLERRKEREEEQK